jgi:DNA-binding NarL/FixJ family response regulator
MSSGGAELVTVVAGLLDPLLGRGLVEVLREDEGLKVLATDLDRQALERVVVRSWPRVAVVGEGAGEGLLARLKSSEAAPGVVVIAHEPSPQRARRFLGAGATCIAQSAGIAEVLATVHRAARGEREVVGLGDAGAGRPHADPKRLTRRETEVFEYLSEGMSYALIALEMGIGIQTVRTHAKAVFRKRGVQNRQQLIAKCRSGGQRGAVR